jgi:sterol 3beta-glucosyltransferase
MHIIMVTVGTRGDIQPFVALGKGLARAGYRVTIATHDDYASFVTEHGLGFRPVGGSFKKVVESDLGREWIESADNLRRYLDLSRRVFEPLLLDWTRDAHEAVLDADAVVFHGLTRGAYDCAEKRGVPAIGVNLAPAWPSVEHSMFFPRAPWGWLRRWLSEQALRGMCKLARPAYDEYRRNLGLAAFRTPNPWREMVEAGVHYLYLYSPHVGHAPSDWPDNLHVTGSCTLDTTGGWTPPTELVDFLAAGPPPVYVGFGSMTGRSPKELAQLALEAVALAKQRAVVVTGWGGIASEARRDDVLVVESVPHEWLFPRCSAVVHHGGAGTVMAGLAAGRPTVVTAFFGDQPYWGYRVHALGAGPAPILRRDLSVQRLADAMRRVVSEESYRRSAESVAAALVAEDGVARAVATIRTILAEPAIGSILPQRPA